MLSATEKNVRAFGLSMGIVCLIAGAIVSWRSSGALRWPVAGSLWAASGLLWALALVRPRLLAPVYRPWSKLPHGMGLALTWVIMTFVYFTVLVPFTFIRWKDPLRRRLGAPSYWEPHRNAEPTLERFHRPF
ncbi:MAG: hypothetical protein HY721_02345 [Planctomycetes bacterium]|nr:hypothetical protein [Planctomycetota bacterium]